jgi:GNAT superfamily N-acetyltransferase
MNDSSSNVPQRVGTIWTHDLQGSLAGITLQVSPIFRAAGPEIASQLANPDLARRFAAGRRCYAAWVEDQLAAYGWVSFGTEYVGELGLTIRLFPCEAYIWDCYTFPAFRGKHLYAALLVHILQELRVENRCRVWIGADFENIPSQRGIDRAGFQRIADVLIHPVNALRLAWAQGYPDVLQSLVDEACRVFLDNRNRIWLDPLPAANSTE